MRSDAKCPAHRILSRPWSADPVLSDVLGNCIAGKKSLTKLTKHSPDIELIYKYNRESIERSPVKKQGHQ